ncbi:helix-turn-helix transcriptional regulator [Dactylosporangium vinaceum]|uniref:TetR/AcrR family transcriptional regulator n=1 Tax=Dactylosporangium vinaceum TaxID=53362 RepID=A0ABV5LZE3_9ACTN|nr:TetR family transcriptional regulator [Dactylosporangium vinaceum]UAB92592.1 helix-turn-helix transcriptional regulator [Dactylosporangium vinaceum]
MRAVTAEVRQPGRSDARDNRTRILAVARAAFAADGLDVPIREIARRAEVGPATVYRHFPTKEALFAAAFAAPLELCSTIVAEGLAAHDPWRGFCLVLERLMEVHALDRGFARAFTSLPYFTADRDRTMQMLLRLIHRAKSAGALRSDFVLEDLVLALMANDGIQADSQAARTAASRRLAALMLQSFHAHPVPTPLPPPARLPLTLR